MSEEESIATQPASSFSNLQQAGRQWRLVLKELREIFRDRRTIVTLVLMPIMIYPLLALVFQRFLLTSLTGPKESVYALGVESELEKRLLVQQLQAGQEVLDGRAATDREPVIELELPAFSWTFMHANTIERNVADSDIHLGMISKRRVGATMETGLATPLTWELFYRSGSQASVDALHFVEERLQALNESQVDSQLRGQGIAAMLPAAVKRKPISFAGAPIFSLAALIPLILVLTTMTGAVYPAIDLTAGERERGTMEMLIAAPVPRLGLLLAKYVAVLAVALLTAIVNLMGMTITAQSTGLATMLFGEAGMTPAIMFNVFLLLGLFAAFFSGLLLAVTSYARSFKEAQAYIIPLMLICLVPGVVCLLPGLEFSLPMAVVPLVNIVMLGRDLLEGDVAPGLAAASVFSTALYVIAAIALASRIFGTDAVLSGGPSTWGDAFRRPFERQQATSVATAMFVLALLFPCYFVAAGTLAQLRSDTSAARVVKSGLVTALVFVAIPAAIALFQRIRPGTGLGLRRPSIMAVAGAAFLGVAVWPFAYEIYFVNEWVGINRLNFENVQLYRNAAAELRRMPFPLLVAMVAIVPGICEEFFFRGLLFSAFRQALSAKGTIVAAAVLFGLFHVVSGNAFLPERFLPSAFLGLILGWVRWKSDSVIPAMITHSLHNAALLAVTYWEQELTARGIGIDEQSHLPLLWIGVATCVAACAAWMVNQARGDRTEANRLLCLKN
jgi:sodium transport system permease protein